MTTVAASASSTPAAPKFIMWVWPSPEASASEQESTEKTLRDESCPRITATYNAMSPEERAAEYAAKIHVRDTAKAIKKEIYALYAAPHANPEAARDIFERLKVLITAAYNCADSGPEVEVMNSVIVFMARSIGAEYDETAHPFKDYDGNILYPEGDETDYEDDEDASWYDEELDGAFAGMSPDEKFKWYIEHAKTAMRQFVKSFPPIHPLICS